MTLETAMQLAHGTPEYLDAEGDPDEPEATRRARQELLTREVLIQAEEAPLQKAKRRPAGQASAQAAPVRIGVVCMTKRPNCFETWLHHHFSTVGAERIYLRVEDTPELEQLLAQPPWDRVVRAKHCRNTVRDWSGQTRRQVVFVDDAIEWAREDGLTHLLHCDDDELLHCPSGRAAFVRELEALPLSVGNVHALTLEALVPSIECTNPFATARAFKHKPGEYSSYGSARHNAGKSLGVLRCKRLHCDGPHHFSKKGRSNHGDDETDGEAAFDWSDTHVLPPRLAVLLHYESCTFDRWLLKFSESAKHLHRDVKGGPVGLVKDSGAGTSASGGSAGGREANAHSARKPQATPQRRQGYTFRFYCESLGACTRLLKAKESGYPGQLREAESFCRNLWMRWKVAPAGLELPPAAAVAAEEETAGAPLPALPVLRRDLGLTLLPVPAAVWPPRGEWPPLATPGAAREEVSASAGRRASPAPNPRPAVPPAALHVANRGAVIEGALAAAGSQSPDVLAPSAPSMGARAPLGMALAREQCAARKEPQMAVLDDSTLPRRAVICDATVVVGSSGSGRMRCRQSFRLRSTRAAVPVVSIGAIGYG